MLPVWGGMAHADTGKIGPCYGHISATGISKSGKGRISAAVVIPSDKLARFEGATVKAIRVGLVTADGVSNLTAWLRDSIGGDNLCEANFSTVTAGWNEAELPSATTISANGDLAIGFSFDQASSVKCLSAAGDDSDNGCWLAKDDAWKNRSGDYDGSWSVEIMVEGSMVPGHNLLLEDASADTCVVLQGHTLYIDCAARNTALAEIAGGVDYIYNVGGLFEGSFHSNATLAYGDTDSVRLAIPTDAVSTDSPMNLTITATAAADEDESDNTATVKFATYTTSLPRTTLLEEFTSEECPNCPRAIQAIETCMEEGYDEKLIQISHHVGYKDDWLTVEEDEAYEWFYGDNGTYAPAGMLDRTQRSEFNSSVPVFNIGYADDLRPMLNAAIAEPAFAEVSAQAAYDSATRRMDVSIEMARMPQLEVLCAEPRLTLIVLEDSILHHNQAGYSSSTFRHRHVYRKCLSDIWGDPIAWDGSSATASYSIVLPDEWDAHYVEAVAFISSYDSADRNNCKVLNAAHASIKDLVSSVKAASTGGNAIQTEYFDLSGRKIPQPSHGVSLKRAVFPDGSSQTTKTVRP